MHPETKNNTKTCNVYHRHEHLKLQPSHGLVASYDIQPGNGNGSIPGHKHTCLLK